jgi:hypothetical protein
MLAAVAVSFLLSSASFTPSAHRAGSSARADDFTARIAPDGRAGFGFGRTRRELEKLFRSPSDDERAFLDGLRDVARDVELELQAAHVRYDELGYYDVLGLQDPTPAALAARFRELAHDVPNVLHEGGPRAELVARLLSDPRFRLRVQVSDGVRRELSDLRGALALLRAQTDGWVDLGELDVSAITRRADLAAARLRAIRLDLIALRESPAATTASGPLQVDYEHLLVLAHTYDHVPIEAAPVLARLERTTNAMSGTLFTTRLALQCTAEYKQRAEELERAAERFARARDVDPDSPRADQAPKNVRALTKSERRQRAAKCANEATLLDPLHDEYVWLMAATSEIAYGKLAARPWFDRYLALHGIRASESKSYQLRTLTREEERALVAVQENELLSK